MLNRVLRCRITGGQATLEESRMAFLYVEFINTKPTITYLFALDEWITIGRSKENKICVHNEMFSRLHCKIGYIDNKLFLVDLGSAYGVILRRGLFQKIMVGRGGQEVLETGDRIIIGQYKMKIRIMYGYDAMD